MQPVTAPEPPAPTRLGGPPLLIAAHGSAEAAGAAELEQLATAVRRLAPGLAVGAGCLELSPPPLEEAAAELLATRAGELVVVPLMLLAAGHVKRDLPEVVDRLRHRHPGARIRYGRDLGVHPDLLAVARDRLAAAVRPSERAGTAVLLVGRGASDPDANADVAKIARLLWEPYFHHGGLDRAGGEHAHAGAAPAPGLPQGGDQSRNGLDRGDPDAARVEHARGDGGPAPAGVGQVPVGASPAAIGPHRGDRSSHGWVGQGLGGSPTSDNRALLPEHRQPPRSQRWSMVEFCYAGITEPRVPEGLERCWRLGARRIVALPYLLFAGRLVDRVRRQCAEFAARHPEVEVRTAAHLGPDERIARLVLARYQEALTSTVRMSCDLCVYRLGGHEHHAHGRNG